MKRITVLLLLLLKTLEINAQSPRFSFTSDTITLKKSTRVKTTSFNVYKGSYTSKDQVYGKKAILGDIIQSDTTIQFIPLLSFQKNSKYTVIYKDQTYPFTIALDASYASIHVETIYPNVKELPSNFLKWYIRFSKPVNPSKIYDHIDLIDTQTNTKVDRAILPLETPLLSDDGTLLTLWIEPGRQKRDLGPNKRLGEVLIPDHSYTLVIDKDLKDKEGIPMNVAFRHSFKVHTSDRVKPTITSWALDLPSIHTKQDLHIHLKEDLDYGSLQNSVQIVNKVGQTIEGDFLINTNKKSIIFKPLNNWIENDYILISMAIVEDISGNNLERLFDQDITIKKKSPVLEIPFSLK